MTSNKTDKSTKLPSTGGLKSQLMIQSLIEERVKELSAEVKRVMLAHGPNLDPEKTYIKPRCTLVQIIATGPEIEESLLKLHKLEKGEHAFHSEDELIKAIEKLQSFMQKVDEPDEPRLLIDPPEQRPNKPYGAVVAQVQEMNEDYSELLTTLREHDVLKPYLRAMFTPGNTIRNSMTARNCLPSALVLIFVNEVRIRMSLIPTSGARTAWVISAFMPAGTIQSILTWDSENQELVANTTSNVGVTDSEVQGMSTSARMNYFSDERLWFFSDTDLPLHPFFFNKPVPMEDAFEWAKSVQTDSDMWDYLRYKLVPELPRIIKAMEENLTSLQATDETAKALLPLIREHRASLENPEFFLEFVLTLSALPRTEGAGLIGGLGGFVSGLLMSILAA